jgi:hypothetical protein
MPPEAPPAPAAPVAPAAPKAPALPNAPKVELSASSITPTSPIPPPKKGSAREGLVADLSKFADKKATPTPTPDPKTPEPQKAPDKAPEPPKAGEDDKTNAPEPDKKGKISPWKIVDEYKEKLAKAEAARLEIEKRAIPEDKWKAKEAEIEKATARLKELEDEIRYVNYSKSEEFKQKHEIPYQQAFTRAMSELGELQVQDGEDVRSITPNDILELVNLPLAKAYQLANEKFGDISHEVMAHRKEIRGLWDKQAQALEDVRKEGAERDKKFGEQRTQAMERMSSEIRETWSRSNEEITADPKYGKFFTPVEGDENINQRLAKGFELADRAFSENPADPNLPADKRQAIVKRHAAIRNRAAAFGRLVYEVGQRDTTIAELQKQIAAFKSGEPDRSGSTKPAVPPATKSTMTGVMEELRKRAKQV